jgi:hypothetical protein
VIIGSARGIGSARLCLFLAACFVAVIAVVGADKAFAVLDPEYKSTWVPLPESEDAPLCATTGHRVKLVYYRPSVPVAATPQIESDLRSIIRRMNSKLRSQALLSSNNNNPLEIKVDCDAAGQPRIYSLLTQDFKEIYSALGDPRGAQAVKYLVFQDGNSLPAGESDGKTGGGSNAGTDPRYWTKSSSDEPVSTGSQSNYSRVESHWAMIWRNDTQGKRDFWHTHVTLHELFHSMGAVQRGPESDPVVGGLGGHCSGNIDLMCEPGLFGSDPCPPGSSEPSGPAYETPAGIPLDCHFDTYFDAAAESGEWLSRNWNLGGAENPYLANPNTYVPAVKSGLEFDLASPSTGRLDLVVRAPDSSLRHRTRTNGTWANWVSLGGSLTSAPVLISPEAGRLDVFACSYDGTVAHRTYASSAWGAWQSLGSGGSGCTGLDAVSWGPGRLDLIVRDGSNLYHRSKSGETWSGWTTLANAGTFTVNSLPTVVSRKSGELTVFVRNGSSDIRVRAFASNAWGSWESIGSPNSGAIGSPEAVSSPSSTQPVGTAHVFARGYNLEAWGRRLFNGGMSLWRNYGDYKEERGNGRLAAVARPDDAIDLYGIDLSGRMQARRNAYQMSTTWQELGGQFREVAPEATAVETGGAWLNAVGAIGEDGKLYIGDDSAAGWGGWKQVGWPTDVSEKDAFEIPDGRPWQIRPIPIAGSAALHQLEAVSCAAPDACIAVGHYLSEYANALRWDGIHWSSASVPLPPLAQGSSLKGVSCTAPTLCTAVGQYKDNSGVWRPWALRWDGSVWTQMTMPSVASGNAYLAAVSCTAADACTAVGNYQGTELEPLVLRWTGGSQWTQAGLAGPSGDAYLKGVSCSPATSDCKAVGFYHSASGWRMLAASGTAATWSLQQDPEHPAGATFSQLNSVSCTATAACTAVGVKLDAENRASAVAMRWNGTKWAMQSTPVGGSTQSELHAVSCVTSTICVATGLDSAAGPDTPLAMRWDGTAWSVEPTPDPSGTQNYVGLYGVSCPYATACMSVGWQRVGESEIVPLTERLQGGPPSFTPQGVTGVAKNQATLRAWVNPNGSETKYRFEWGLTSAYGKTVPAAPEAIGSGLVDVQIENQISGLVGEQTYHYRVIAENPEGTTFGPDQQFTTPMWRPTVTAKPATAVGSGQATLWGTVNPNGFAATYQFQWGLTTAYGNTVPVTPKSAGSGTAAQSVSEAISGLVGEKTYHYRIVATNSEGTSYSEDQTLPTPNWRPKATTNPATEMLGESTKLNAIVNPSGFPTTYQFQYGLTKTYETTVPATPVSVGSGTADMPVNFKAGGLKPLTTYNYQVVATNGEGTTYGENQVFTTRANNFWTEQSPATLIGEGVGFHTFGMGAVQLRCKQVSYSGSLEVPVNKVLTLLPAYTGCTFTTGLPGPPAVSMGGCKFELNAEGTVSIAGATCATSPITFTSTFATLTCSLKIGPQTLTDLRYEVTGSGKERKLVTTKNLVSLKYTAAGNLCPSTGTFSDGTYSGVSNLSAKTNAGAAQGLWAQ